jgi:hypothetical protein
VDLRVGRVSSTDEGNKEEQTVHNAQMLAPARYLAQFKQFYFISIIW